MSLSQEFVDKLSQENPVFKKFFELARYDNLTPEEKEIYDREQDKQQRDLYDSAVRHGEMRGKIEVAIKLRDAGISFELITNATGIRREEIENLSLQILNIDASS